MSWKLERGIRPSFHRSLGKGNNLNVQWHISACVMIFTNFIFQISDDFPLEKSDRRPLRFRLPMPIFKAVNIHRFITCAEICWAEYDLTSSTRKKVRTAHVHMKSDIQNCQKPSYLQFMAKLSKSYILQWFSSGKKSWFTVGLIYIYRPKSIVKAFLTSKLSRKLFGCLFWC